MPRERRAILAALPSKGFALDEGGDHWVLRFRHKGLIGGIATIVSRGSGFKDYPDELLSRMSKHLWLTRGQLNDLIDCPMDETGYIAALRQRGRIRDAPKKQQDLPKKKK